MRKRRLTRVQMRNRRILAVIIAMAAMLFLTSFFVKPRYEKAEVYREYAVEPGDTLCTIAKRCTDGDWRYTAEEIARVNGIKNRNEIFAGDVILIPEGEK